MQASSAGLAVTMGTTQSSGFTSLTGLQSTISNINTTANNIYNLNYSQPTTYASTNPFLTGAYLTYTPGEYNTFDKFSSTGNSKDTTKPFSYTESSNYLSDTTKYSTLNTKPSYETTESSGFSSTEQKFNTIGGKSGNYLSTAYSSEMKFSPGSRDGKASGNSYETSPNVTQSGSVLLGVEDTPTPTSSIETEDSTTREVGEKDVEGDGEQSD